LYCSLLTWPWRIKNPKAGSPSLDPQARVTSRSLGKYGRLCNCCMSFIHIEHSGSYALWVDFLLSNWFLTCWSTVARQEGQSVRLPREWVWKSLSFKEFHPWHHLVLGLEMWKILGASLPIASSILLLYVLLLFLYSIQRNVIQQLRTLVTRTTSTAWRSARFIIPGLAAMVVANNAAPEPVDFALGVLFGFGFGTQSHISNIINY
jgi:hypothetical protein